MTANTSRITLARAALGVAVTLVAAAALAACGGGSSTGGHASAVGQPPPEWAENSGAWPAHNYDLANTRATTRTAINSHTVAKLKVKWRFPFKGASAFGVFSSTPIVLNETVYVQDLNSNVYALDRASGKLEWQHAFNRPSIGPNGLAYGYGRIYGATETDAFALDARNGKRLWSRRLVRNTREGIDMAPQIFDNTVVVSTVPGNASSFYKGGAFGVVWALDAATGKPKWKFNTVSDGAKLWGHPELNSGGGLWYPPSVDGHGRVFLSVANPAPLYGTPKFPNGSSRPGPDLYTNSVVALNGRTGKLLWYRQVLPHDLRDYDLMIPAITATIPIQGVRTEVVLAAGKMGKAYAIRADNGHRLWTVSVGEHRNDTGPLPRTPVDIVPGDFGGVETPMAFASGRLFVPSLDFPARASASGLAGGFASDFTSARGGFTAIDAATGKVLWQRKLPSADFGAATVANDVVFTSSFAGVVYAFDTKTGKTLWTRKAPAGINSFPAIDGDTLLVGAAASGFDKKPQFQLIAYSLSAPSGASATTTPSGSTLTAASATSAHGHSAAVTPTGTAVQVRGGEFFFKLSTTSIAKPGKVTFVFKNVGHVLHDFTIGGKSTPLIEPGKTATLVVSFAKKGAFTYLCTVLGHAAAGMKGVFTVR